MSNRLITYLATFCGLYEWFDAMAGWMNADPDSFAIAGLAAIAAFGVVFGLNSMHKIN